ncbi:MAG: hypothetical protein RJQ09_07575 [Cyclobacteriaceae bacterium]
MSDKNDKPKVNAELEGFNIKIDSFGEVKTSFDVDELNVFLNRNVEDKKLKNRKDIDDLKKPKN